MSADQVLRDRIAEAMHVALKEWDADELPHEPAVQDENGTLFWDELDLSEFLGLRLADALLPVPARPRPPVTTGLPFAASDYGWQIEQVDAHSSRVVSRGLSHAAAEETAAALADDQARADALTADGTGPHPAHRPDKTGAGR